MNDLIFGEEVVRDFKILYHIERGEYSVQHMQRSLMMNLPEFVQGCHIYVADFILGQRKIHDLFLEAISNVDIIEYISYGEVLKPEVADDWFKAKQEYGTMVKALLVKPISNGKYIKVKR